MSDEDELYCICNQPYDPQRVYVGCDQCNDWLHLKCAGLTKKEATSMKSYICPRCATPHKGGDNESGCCSDGSDSPGILVVEVEGSLNVDHNKSLSVDVIQQSTIEAVVGSNVLETFEHELTMTSTTFLLTRQEWNSLQTEGQKLHPSWGDKMAKKLKDSNPYCSFAFKRHWLKKSMRKSSEYFFKASAYCTFSSCTVMCQLRITSADAMRQCSDVTVHVDYSGHLKHCGKKSRHIKGESRELTSNLLTKYSPSYLRHQGLSLMPSEVFASGNRDGIGATKFVLQKISSDLKNSMRLDEDLIKSLLILKQQLIKEDPGSSAKVQGYIQQISASPFYVIAFNEGSVRLYHDLGDESVIHCDSTGTIVANCKAPSMCAMEGESKRMLYYAIVIPSRKKKQSPLAVAEMISTEHSALAVANFIARLRRAEKLLYSYKSANPKVVVIDRSLALLIAFLKEFNNESIINFLNWSYRRVKGDVGNSRKIVPHACLSHVMKDARSDFKPLFSSGKNYSIWMYTFSLVANAFSLPYIEMVLRNIKIVFCSKVVTNDVLKSYEWLQKQFNFLSYEQIKDHEQESSGGELNTFIEDETIKDCDSDESDVNPFEIHFKTFVNNVKIVEKGLKNNPLYCPEAMSVLVNKWLPTVPFWSGLLLGDQTRHRSSTIREELSLEIYYSKYHTNMAEMSRTNGVMEQWNCLLKRKDHQSSRMRPDEFLLSHYRVIKGRQLLFIDNLSEKQKRGLKSRKRSGAPIEEKWQKKTKRPCKNGRGFYQQKPEKELNPFKRLKKKKIQRKGIKKDHEDIGQNEEDVVLQGMTLREPKDTSTPISKEKSKYELDHLLHSGKTTQFQMTSCMKQNLKGVTNVGNTCWLSCCIQFMNLTILSHIEHQIQQNKKLNSFQLSYWQMNSPCSQPLNPRNLLAQLRSKYPRLAEMGSQQDPAEGLQMLIEELCIGDETSAQFESKLHVKTHCTACNVITVESEYLGCILHPHIPNEQCINLQHTVQAECIGMELKSQTSTCACGSNFEYEYSYQQCPQYLIIHLSRVRFINGKLKKLFVAVTIPETLEISTEEGIKIYDLKAIIVHHGRTPHGGHYTTLVCQNDADMWIEVNDEVKQVSCRSTSYIQKNASMVLYISRSIEEIQNGSNDQQSLLISVKCKWCAEEFNLRSIKEHENKCPVFLSKVILRLKLDAATFSISVDDMFKISSGFWLNDNVINYFMALTNLKLKIQRDKLSFMRRYLTSKVVCLSSFFYESIRRYLRGWSGYSPQGICKTLIKEDLNTIGGLLIPVHQGAHWLLLHVNVQDKIVTSYDSMSTEADHVENKRVVCNMIDEVLFDGDEEKWTFLTAKDIPQQENGNDCGVFLCKFVDVIAKKRKMKFDSNQKKIRKWLQLTLLKGPKCMKKYISKGEAYDLVTEDSDLLEELGDTDSEFESDSEMDDENLRITNLLIPEFNEASILSGNEQLFKFASDRELYVASAVSALKGIPENDGDIQRTMIIKVLKEVEPNLIKEAETFTFTGSGTKCGLKNLNTWPLMHPLIINEIYMFLHELAKNNKVLPPDIVIAKCLWTEAMLNIISSWKSISKDEAKVTYIKNINSS